MEIYKAKSNRGIIYNDHFPAEPPRRKLPGFIRPGGLNLKRFSQEDAKALKKVNPDLFNKLFTTTVKPEKKEVKKATSDTDE